MINPPPPETLYDFLCIYSKTNKILLPLVLNSDLEFLKRIMAPPLEYFLNALFWNQVKCIHFFSIRDVTDVTTTAKTLQFPKKSIAIRDQRIRFNSFFFSFKYKENVVLKDLR